jgi:hypothetical protein
LLPRWQFALALTQDEIKGTRVGWPVPGNWPTDSVHVAEALSTCLLGEPIAAPERAALLAELRAAGASDSELPAILAAGLLASPAFQWR